MTNFDDGEATVSLNRILCIVTVGINSILNAELVDHLLNGLINS